MYIENNCHLQNAADFSAAIIAFANKSFSNELKNQCSSFLRSSTIEDTAKFRSWNKVPTIPRIPGLVLGEEQFLHTRSFDELYQGLNLLQFIRSTVIGDLMFHEITDYETKVKDVVPVQMAPTEAFSEVLHQELKAPWLPLEGTPAQANDTVQYNRFFRLISYVPRFKQLATDALLDLMLWDTSLPEAERISAADLYIKKGSRIDDLYWEEHAPVLPVTMPREVAGIQRYTSYKSRAVPFGEPPP